MTGIRNFETRSQAMLIVLGVVAGSTDVISFLGLDGLFTGHVTGNLVLLAARVGDGRSMPVAKMLAVPVYIAAGSVASLLAVRLKAIGRASLEPLLLMHILLLTLFLLLGTRLGPRIDAAAASAVVAGMFGVAAMAVHNTLVQTSLPGGFPTAMMTGNVTRVAIAVGEMFGSSEAATRDAARDRVAQTLPVIAAFALGCGLGAAFESVLGLRALFFPVAIALVALAMAGLRPAAPTVGPVIP